MENHDTIFAKLASDQYFSKLDFAKGYWQIAVKEQYRPKTAFGTNYGLHQCVRLPFGMINSGASYCRMMRKLLLNLEHADSFVDDVLVHPGSWKSHLESLQALLLRIRQEKLTVKPSKCFCLVI